MNTGCFVALAVMVVGTQLGCSSAEPTGESSDDYTAVSSGLWALEGTAEHGDIELLQLTRRNVASIVRETPALGAAAGMANGMGAAPRMPQSGGPPGTRTPPSSRAAMGDVMRAGSAAPKLSLLDDAASYDVALLGDSLELKANDGRVLRYRRSYRLYCVPKDRGLEATVLIELGKEPQIVGVNGDGRVFPTEGTHAASVRTDVLFRLQDYVILSRTGTSNITVKLPWSDMGRQDIDGTIAITGAPDAVVPTPISCERF